MSQIKRLMAAVVLLALLLLPMGSVTAQQSQNGASGLSISPTRLELSLKPGQADKLDINLKNVTAGPVVAKPFVNDFEADNLTGNPRVIVDSNKKSPASIQSFLSGLDDVPLKAGEQKKVTILVQVPNTQPPGGYYGLVRYQAVPANQAAGKPGEVALSASVSSVVLIEVPGNIRQQVQLQNIKLYHKDKAGSFFTKAPDQAGIEIKNLGNSFVKPFGRISVQNSLRKEVYSYEVNNISPRANVLPNSTRTFRDAIKNIKMPGRYTVQASISYGAGSDVLVYKKTFWYIPTVILIIILIVIAALIGAMVLAYRRYRTGFSRRRR